jgi:hypothetical protein
MPQFFVELVTKKVDSFEKRCIIPSRWDGVDAQTSASRKITIQARTSLVPARASLNAETAPRIRYIQAGTAIFKYITRIYDAHIDAGRTLSLDAKFVASALPLIP